MTRLRAVVGRAAAWQLLLAGGASWETRALAALSGRRDLVVLKRCVDVDDLLAWLRALPSPVPVTETVVLGCDAHGDARPTWTYVEADATEGVARRRCLACAQSTYVLDSEQRWTYPPTWACQGCGHSIAEVAAGLRMGP